MRPGAGAPVLAIPQSDSQLRPLQKISKVLVTTDCSPYSKVVVDYAFQLKQLIDCELYLLYVVELSNAIKFGIRQGYFTDAVSKMRTWARNQLENLTPYQFVKDKSVHWLVEEGPVSDKITECADAYDADLSRFSTDMREPRPTSRNPIGPCRGRIGNLISRFSVDERVRVRFERKTRRSAFSPGASPVRGRVPYFSRATRSSC